ncbi:conserved protein of unknown function [Pseudorhizobium banfieldiae]|uniref:Uncharacterized protein n=1 Tax=Pseudorhizobium banfieldiae TaxID=1125847 RepID=L0NE96_9HYPH|nr:hypothetical protein [Pseudorhizobium banfieldiae]CAD6606082.1 hypothetical protein RNT25_01780 [arsenite-oxidising bacterium NT-25]CCF19126.1 conserved protein of unknown function [Pseudorhizobium banfieldiae]
MPLAMKTTQRGFVVAEFVDRSGVSCSLQESSLANEASLWLGCDDADPKILLPDRGWTQHPFLPGTVFNTRMHLTQDMVKDLLPYLQHFAEHGDLRLPPDG